MDIEQSSSSLTRTLGRKKENMYNAINSTLVILIVKNLVTKTIKDYMLMSCCPIIYKLISNVMTTILGRVQRSIIDQSQVAFIPGQHIQDHIILAYELIKGHARKGWAPRCMLQMDL